MLVWGSVFYAGMAGVALLWRTLLYGEPILFTSAGAEAAGIQPFRDLGIGLAAGLAVLGVSDLATRFTRWGEELARTLGMALVGLSIPGALFLALLSGFAEEMLFRGALQPRVGWLAASVLFGLVHFAPRRELLPWTGFAVLAGLLFGLLFEYTGNLIAPVAAHVLVNGVNLPRLIREYG